MPISQTTRDLAAKIKGAIEIDPKTGTATIKEGTYTDLLPDELTLGQIRAFQKFNSDVIAASALALGEAALPIYKKNKDLGSVELEIPAVGKDKINIISSRSSVNINPQTKAEVTSYGGVRASYTTYSTKPRGEFKSVKEELAEAAMAALAPKS